MCADTLISYGDLYKSLSNDHDSNVISFAENERLDRDLLSHYVYKHVLNGNYISPINVNMKKCLDIGFSSGIWMMEVASEFPNCDFYGIDLNPMNPESTYPKNCFFQKGDFNSGLPFADETFDLVHIRHVLSAKDFHKLLNEIVRVTKKGGYFEFQQPFNLKNCGPTGTSFAHVLLTEKDIDLTATSKLPALLSELGMKNIKLQPHTLPIAGPVGEYYLGIVKLSAKMTSQMDRVRMGCATEEEFCQKVVSRLAVECEKYCTTIETYVGYAQKI